MISGLFISIEGIEGSGKTTQIKLLYEYIKTKGYDVILTREPGGCNIGEQIRHILLDPNNNITPLTELLLYMAARIQHIHEVIIPALSEGKIVITDRFIDATIAYQGYGRGINIELIHKLNRLVIQDIKPDITFILDIEPDEGILRAVNIAKERPEGYPDRIEKEDISFHQRVRQGYLDIAAKEPDRVIVINGRGGIDEIHQKICNIVSARLV
jgi:dTMP kinase